jgi:hypothetical protein
MWFGSFRDKFADSVSSQLTLVPFVLRVYMTRIFVCTYSTGQITKGGA